MKSILITGGTIFVSKYLARHYVNIGYNVYVLNRNTHKQVSGVNLIEADKNNINGKLLPYKFDVVIAVNIYTKDEMKHLLENLSEVKEFVFISSSAVYPETTKLPFSENSKTGFNIIWKDYGINKIEAERYLLSKINNAYIIRPPYLYGEMQNLYREGFIFDCARKKAPFYMPYNKDMKIQLFDISDLALFIDNLISSKSKDNIYNVGNTELISIEKFVSVCYDIVGSKLEVVQVDDSHEQKDFFPFYNYEYYLDVNKQKSILKDTINVKDGLQKSYEWYIQNENKILKKPYFDYIEKNIK